uniref:Uncharacterized protein n=1 Tax=Setaria viridis TaxID=4556 RepID=A0A4U6T7J5_SETVI|nr:hypothetical protein SEVIR_9G408800v2 [Setaria viridis]
MPSCERSCGVGGDGAGRRPRRSSSVCPPDSPRKEEWPAAGSRKHLRSNLSRSLPREKPRRTRVFLRVSQYPRNKTRLFDLPRPAMF